VLTEINEPFFIERCEHVRNMEPIQRMPKGRVALGTGDPAAGLVRRNVWKSLVSPTGFEPVTY
jgi:hypothetical protein